MTLTTMTKSRKTTRPAIGYIRVSTLGQAVEGVSLDAQRDAITKHAAAAGLSLIELHQDELSGKRADTRPGLQAALAQACETGAVLIVYSLSRLARSTRDTLAIAEQLESAGADLVSLSERIDTAGACGRMIFRMLAVLAEFERDTIAERTTAALRWKRQQGFKTGGHAPIGFTVDRSEGKPRLVEDAAELQTIETIHQLHRSGLSLRKIATELDARGIKPRRGAKWHAKVLSSIVHRQDELAV